MIKTPAFLLMVLAGAALAETWTVTTVEDTVDPSDGVLSLREAILASNANLDASGQCRGINNISFRLPATNAIAVHGVTAVPYYKLKINYLDPDYARVMNFTPRPTTLPPVRCPVNLDGYSQPGVKPDAPLIEISGEDLPLAFQATPAAIRGEDAERTTELLTLAGRLVRQPAAGETLVGCRPIDPGCPLKRSASGSTIRGILFNHAPQTGLQLFGVDNVTVTGNFFGLDATGENPAPNGRLTQDNRLFSLLLNGSSRNVIGTPGERNYFGVARSHSIMFWPFTAVDGTGDCGQTAAANTVCSQTDIGSSENVVQSNYFGLNQEGTRSLGGICILTGPDRRFAGESGCEEGQTPESAIYTSGGPQIYVFYYPSGVPVSRNSMRRNQIGGLGPREGNVFAAAWTGVTLRAVETEILGNIFGLDARGAGAENIAPFFRQGIVIAADSTGTRVEGNLVANSANFGNLNNPATRYNYGGGVLITGGPTGPGFSDDLPPNVIRENYIGVNIHRRHPGNNLLGVPATNAGGGVSVIWMLPTRIENNVIGYNGYLGQPPVAARSLTLNPNTPNELYFPPRRLVVLGNSMFCNGAVEDGQTCGRGMGIDWSASPAPLPAPAIGDGPTLNDGDDLDDGPAALQNFPTLSAAGGHVTGRLASRPNTRYLIQLFSSAESSGACVPVTTAMQPGFEPDPACANSGSGPGFLAIQGEKLLMEFEVVTGGDGVAEFDASVPANRLVAATATELDEASEPLGTSELSQAVRTGKS
jgi:CSLREA domain-containing protein